MEKEHIKQKLNDNLFNFCMQFGDDILIKQLPTKSLDVVYAAHAWSSFPQGICKVRSKEHLYKALENPCIVGIVMQPDLCNFLLPSEKLIIIANDANLFFQKFYDFTLQNTHPPITRCIADSADIHPTAIIDEFVQIGERVVIGPYAVIRENTIIGDDSFIGSHAVLGEQGTSSRLVDGKRIRFKHLGGVKIGARCHVGAHSTLAKGDFYEHYTELEDDVFLAFHCSIGHGAIIGKATATSTGITVGGYTHIAPNAWIGLSAIISDSIEIGEDVSIKIGSVVVSNLDDKAQVSGNFAIPHQQNLRRNIVK